VIVGTLTVSVAANWPKLVGELHPVLGPCGYSHDRLPGPVRVLADAPISPEVLAQAQAVVDAHDPSPTPEQVAEQEDRTVASNLVRRDRLLALALVRASTRWAGLTAAQRQRAQGAIDAAADRVLAHLLG